MTRHESLTDSEALANEIARGQERKRVEDPYLQFNKQLGHWAALEAEHWTSEAHCAGIMGCWPYWNPEWDKNG